MKEEIRKHRPVEYSEALEFLEKGQHPVIQELKYKLHILRTEAMNSLNTLIDREAEAWGRVLDDEGQRYQLTPEKPDPHDYEDRDAVRFKVTDRMLQRTQSHREWWGYIASDRRSFIDDVQMSVTYYRLAGGKVKSGGGGLLILRDANPMSFRSEWGIWDIEEWLLFKHEGVIPKRFW